MATRNGALTAFGAACRALRNAHCKLTIDQAKALAVSPSVISSVETGAEAVPADYVARLARWLQLSTAEEHRLAQVAADAEDGARALDGSKAKFVVPMAQSIEQLTPGQIIKLRAIMSGAR